MLAKFDKRLSRSIIGLPESWQPLMAAVSFLGEPVVVITAAVFGFLVSGLRGQSQIQKAITLAVAAFCVNIIIKQIIHRARPNNLRIAILGIESYSFPSGHAFGSVIFYGLFAIQDIKYLAKPWNLVLGGLIWLTILLIGISRVYLKRHYPTDVLAGWLLGGLSLFIVCLLAF